MRLSIVWTILRKEITEALRDRVTLLVVIGLPVLVYPLLITGVTKVQTSQADTEEKRVSKIAVWGAAPSALTEWFQRTNTLAIESWSGATEGIRAGLESGALQPPARPDATAGRTNGAAAAPQEPESDLIKAARAVITSRELDAVLVVWPGFGDALDQQGLARATVYFDSVRPASVKAGERVDAELQSFRQHLLKERERARNLAAGFTRAIDARMENVAPSHRKTGQFIGFAMPFILIMLSAIGALYSAIDVTAGEKDRVTMQTLLCAPVHTIEIVAGKFCAVWMMSLIGALANTVSLGLTLGRVAVSVGGLSVSPLTFLLAFACLLPVTCTVAALFLAVAALGRDAKDAGNFLTPTLSLLLLPMAITMLPGVELNAWTSFVPMVNIALLIKAIFVGEASADAVLLTLIASAMYAALALLFAARAFSREQILLGGHGALRSLFVFERRANAGPTPGVALTVFAVVLVAMFYGSLVFERWGLIATILVTQYGCFLLPVLALAAWMKFPWKETFSLRVPHWRSVAGCVLLGASASVAIAGLSLRLLPAPESLAKGMQKLLLLGETPAPLGVVWLVVAITPALCEETVFRGMILAGFRRFGAWPAIVVSALLFALAHASIYRLLPTLGLGLVFGYTVWRTRSLYCSILIHLLNNGLIATLVHSEALAGRLGLGDMVMVPWSLTLTALAVMGAGLWMLRPPAAPTALAEEGRSVRS